jgi:hypothetical protein
LGPKLYHSGIGQPTARSTLADANETRDWQIFSDFARVLIEQASQLYVQEPFGAELDQAAYALDSTTIDLCLSLFPWAKFRRRKAAIKLHTLLALRGNGLRHLIACFRPRADASDRKRQRPDQRYWWLQLHRLIASKSQVKQTDQAKTIAALEKLTEGYFSICWQATAVTLWCDRDDSICNLEDGWDFEFEGQTMRIDNVATGRHLIRNLCAGSIAPVLPSTNQPLCLAGWSAEPKSAAPPPAPESPGPAPVPATPVADRSPARIVGAARPRRASECHHGPHFPVGILHQAPAATATVSQPPFRLPHLGPSIYTQPRMPIRNFDGDTFVAFADIAGFKSMMSDGTRGPAALDALYASGFAVLSRDHDTEPWVEGLFVSDCGILFVHRHQAAPVASLEVLLSAVEDLNRRCFERAVSLTTAVAWGGFSYHDRIEIPGIEKNPIYGNAYVSAFTDNEGTPKLYPNECRILKRGLPQEVSAFCTHRTGQIASRIREAENHFYFEWMRPSR